MKNSLNMNIDKLYELNRKVAFEDFDKVRAICVETEKVHALSEVREEFLANPDRFLIVANDLIEKTATKIETTKRYVSNLTATEMKTRTINGKKMRCLTLEGIKKLPQISSLYRAKEYSEYFQQPEEKKSYSKFIKQIAKKEVDGKYNVNSMGRWLLNKRTYYRDEYLEMPEIIEIFKTQEVDKEKLEFLISHFSQSS